MKPTAPFRYNSSELATTPCRGLSLSRYVMMRCFAFTLLALLFPPSAHGGGVQTDAELTKLMVGAWRSPRHDYIYFADGTWSMGKKESGVLHGRWRIRNHRLETSSTYSEGAGPEPGEDRDVIHKLTRDEIIFGPGYEMKRIKLEDVDKPR
jgi:hypothetical protein